MENLKQEYEELIVRFNEYKRITDDKIYNLKAENKKLGKSLAVFFNIVEISGYVNSFISDDNLMVLINDMIIGVLGSTNSTIYTSDKDKFVVKASNNVDSNGSESYRCLEYMKTGQPCIINIDSDEESNCDIRSILGIPICFGSVNIGYIVAEHTLYNFFNDEHKMFLGAIANQIAVAIENARLYKKIQIAAEIDPLLGVYNRRTFFTIVESKLKAEHNKDYAIVMVDFDNFKGINDTLGHQFGDEVL
ncbi:MAG: sensor domain-containing diguanylate cyclase, partial [Clostridium sp.]